MAQNSFDTVVQPSVKYTRFAVVESERRPGRFCIYVAESHADGERLERLKAEIRERRYPAEQRHLQTYSVLEVSEFLTTARQMY
jgi:hypothetical protein